MSRCWVAGKEVSKVTSEPTSVTDNILTRCTISRTVAAAPARHIFSKAIQATCMPMPTRATTRCLLTSGRVSSKLPVGRMRGGSFSMPFLALRVKHTRCWSGIGSCMISKTARVGGRSRRGVSFAPVNRIRCLTGSKPTWRSWTGPHGVEPIVKSVRISRSVPFSPT